MRPRCSSDQHGRGTIEGHGRFASEQLKQAAKRRGCIDVIIHDQHDQFI
ncbi:hypothetical protein AAW51_0383 [Caldimonas brevitalea]|uniref:Uncharacterized protein n=1 Tax=Caldimonas brevitalea TaxID=413882 RepID=A0A0G3BCH8_9BURK|nr:hypothetical protein AAW51_0383 [Caldimonas brevitalea]